MNAKSSELTFTASPAATATARQALTALREAEEPGPVVRRLVSQDLLITWRLADDEQRSELLALVDPAQATQLIDLSCWAADRPDLATLEDTLAPLVASGLPGADRALDLVDGELRTLLLKHGVRIHLREDKDEQVPAAQGSELVACADGYYFIEFPDPELISDVQRGLYAALLNREFADYQPELEAVRHELVSTLEEDAHRWRAARLADLGFAIRDEALAVLTPRTPGEARARAAQGGSHPAPGPDEPPVPVLLREAFSGEAFLDLALERLGEAVPERLATLHPQVSAMTNLFLSATGVDLGDLDGVARSARTARDLVALGLSEAAGGDPRKGGELLAAVEPTVFLQVGLGLLYPLRARARALLGDPRLAAETHPGGVLDSPHRVALAGLDRQVPLRYPPLEPGGGLDPQITEPAPAELQAFSARPQLEHVASLVAEAEALAALLFDGLGWEGPLLAGFPASSMVLTALANAFAGRDPAVVAVTHDEAERFGEAAAAQPPEQILADGLAALAPRTGIPAAGATNPDEETDPRRRLLLRLVLLGRARLDIDAAWRVLLVE